MYTYTGSSLAPIRTAIPPTNINSAFIIFNDMKESLYVFNESIYSALIRCCIINNNLKKALELYDNMRILNILPKLRTISPILSGLLRIHDNNDSINDKDNNENNKGNNENNIIISFKIFEELINTYELIPREDDYINMLKICILYNDRRFYYVLNMYMDDIFIPKIELLDVVKNWFLDNENNGSIIDRYLVAESLVLPDGTVELTGEKLISVDLTDDNRSALMNQVSAFSLKRTGDYINTNKNSKSVHASPESLVYNIDNSSNITVAGVFNSHNNTKSFVNAKHSVNNDTNYDDNNIDGDEKIVKILKRKNNENNPNISNKKIDLKLDENNVVMSNENDTTGIKHIKNDNINDNDNDNSINVDKIKKKEFKVSSKDNKWHDFAKWVQTLLECKIENNSIITDKNPDILPDKKIDISKTDKKTKILKEISTDKNMNKIKGNFDVIIDGANVGYFKQNFAGAPSHIDYRQVDWMIRQLIIRGFKPLLILHCRHLAPGVVPEDRRAIVDRWISEGDQYL